MDDGKSKRSSERSLGFVLTLTLILFISHVSSFDTELESIRQENIESHDVSIFIEERVQYIHSRISLKPLISGIELGTKLSYMFLSKANTTLGKILCTKVKKFMEKVDKKLNAMVERKPKKQRDKRAIEFVGDLISKLFGNPGPSEWKQNTRNILAMKAAIERQISNSVIFHRDIDQNRHAINEQNELLRHISKEVISNSNRLNVVDNSLSEFETYLELETMYHSILEIVAMIDSIKSDAKLSRCNEEGLNQEFLIEHLRDIESNKVGIAPIFASWEWQKYYRNSMCSIGIHDEDLWVTMRIPIVNLAEQLVRVVPTSDQIWIRDNLYNLGIDSVLLKNKNNDIFMSMIKSEFEACSKLDFFRVCNVRKTKFRSSNPFIVPTSISHGRILLTSNNLFANLSAKCTCNGDTIDMYLTTQSIVKINDG